MDAWTVAHSSLPGILKRRAAGLAAFSVGGSPSEAAGVAKHAVRFRTVSVAVNETHKPAPRRTPVRRPVSRGRGGESVDQDERSREKSDLGVREVELGLNSGRSDTQND